MTRQEARALLEEAESESRFFPPDELEQIYQVLFEAAGIGSDPDVMRARALLDAAGVTPTFDQGVTTREPLVTLDKKFTTRFYEAADAAGVDKAEAETILKSALDQTEQFGGDPEGLLLPAVLNWEETAEGLRGRPIGVPDDFVAQTSEEMPGSEGLERFRSERGLPAGRRPIEVEPRYFDGDQYSPAGLPPEEIITIQKRLEKAGLLTSYIPGLWDSNTANAYTEVLAAANRRGSVADDALDFMVSNPVERSEDQFQVPAFVKPDYATLAQDVKSVMRSKLGREPTDEEMGELTGAMGQAYRAGFDAEVARLRSEFDAAPGETPAAVQDVDPVSRFQERFESRFGPEIDRLASLPETRENMNNVFSSLRTMGSLVG